MEREALFSIMAAGLFVVVVWSLAGGLALGGRRELSEPDARHRLAAPVFAGLVVLAFLLGWVLCEPDPADEFASPVLIGLAVVAAGIAGRALVRAGLALVDARALEAPRTIPIATFGLFAPRTHVSPEFRAQARPEVLRAALAHEAAHARGRDPLRIWLAQLATDLQWPIRGTQRRFAAWLTSLEIRRDHDALAAGVRGTDLAEAILLAARLGAHAPAGPTAPVARMVTHERDLALRVRRLYADEAPAPGRRTLSVSLVLALAVALGLGLTCGETILNCVPGVWR